MRRQCLDLERGCLHVALDLLLEQGVGDYQLMHRTELQKQVPIVIGVAISLYLGVGLLSTVQSLVPLLC